MAFVNRKLEENEIREYKLHYPERIGHPKSATIDAESDIRLFCYALDSMYRREPSDIFYFIFDYKGKVFYLDLRRGLKENDVYWYLEYPSDIKKFNSEQLQSLREAMKVYGYRGFNIYDWVGKQKDPSYISLNEEGNVYIEF